MPQDIGGLGSFIGGQLGQAGQAGLFNPMGSPILRALRRRQAIQSARNRMRRGQVAGSLVGLNPAEQRANLAAGERNSAGDTANFLNESQFQEQQGNQDFMRSLLGSERGYEIDRLNQERQAREARRGGTAGMIGGLVGTGIGALAGGPVGAGIGGQLGGSVGGKRMGQQGFQYPRGY